MEEQCCKKSVAWVCDKDSPTCFGCCLTFTIFRRRHHCRACGNVFCSKCSEHFLILPDEGYTSPVRVCNTCYCNGQSPPEDGSELWTSLPNEVAILIFSFIDIPDLGVAAQVSRLWKIQSEENMLWKRLWKQKEWEWPLSEAMNTNLNWKKCYEARFLMGGVSKKSEVYRYAERVIHEASFFHAKRIDILYFFDPGSTLTELPSVIGQCSTLQELSITSHNLLSLPQELTKLTSLQKLGVIANKSPLQADSLCTIAKLTTIQYLILSQTSLPSIPEEFGQLINLEYAQMYSCKITELPKSIGNLSSLKYLYLSQNPSLYTVPESLGQLRALITLDLSECNLIYLPNTLNGLSSLRTLNLKYNRLKELPPSLGYVTTLKELSLENNPLLRDYHDRMYSLKDILDYLCALAEDRTPPPPTISLERINLVMKNVVFSSGCVDSMIFFRTKIKAISPVYQRALKTIIDNSTTQNLELWMELNLTELPPEIGQCTHLKELKLMHQHFQDLPSTLSNLVNLQKFELFNRTKISVASLCVIGSLQNLQYIILSRTPISELPDEFGNLRGLLGLYISKCQLTKLPDTIGNLKALEYLSAAHNQYNTLPPSFGSLSSLISADLSYCRLSELPNTLNGLTSLRVLNLNNNQLHTLPSSLGELANVPLKLDLKDNNQLEPAIKHRITSTKDLLLYLQALHRGQTM